MAEKKSQTIIRAESEEIAAWKEAATIRGVSLNQFLVDAGNRSITASGLGDFQKTLTVTNTVVAPNTDSILTAYDAALNLTPTLTGQRRWVDPIALRDEFLALLVTAAANKDA